MISNPGPYHLGINSHIPSKLVVTFLLTALITWICFATNAQKIMEQHEVVPDVIPVAPKGKIQVSYPSGVNVDYGNELTPTQVKDEPTVKWDVEDNTLYTLCMTDPDAPSRKEHTYREVQHWLVGNIPGTEISKGETLTEYIGSGPPLDTGLHRYVFLVYKQPSKLIFNEPYVTNKSPGNRTHFSIHKFAQKYNLGLPVAGNFYQAQYDDYVPLRYKQPTTT